MHTLDDQQQREPAIRDLRVLAMLPSHNEDRADHLVKLLQTAKQRWGWRIDVFCQKSDREAYADLVAPSGQLLTIPNAVESAVWESDPVRVAAVDRRLREAEIATEVTAGQLVLASQATIGCAFVAPVQRMKLTKMTAGVLADNMELFRILRRFFQFADDMVETTAPDLLLAYEWEKPWRSTVWMAAASRGIPCVAVRRSKLNADHYYWSTDRTLFNTAAREAAIANGKAQASLSSAAVDYMRKFREAPKTVKYVQAKWLQQSQKTWLSWHLQFARSAAAQFLRFVTGRAKRKWLLRKLVSYNMRTFLQWRQQRHFRSFEESELRDIQYVYFPMHKETDLPLVFQAPRWHDQRNTIQFLAGALPSGYRLLVREHRFNIGRRPAGYYRNLMQLPNVVLVDAFGSQFRYINNADLVVTENGTSGWEGLLLGRNVLTLSRTSYDGAGLAVKVDDKDRLGAAILNALRRPHPDAAERDRHLGWMIDAELANSFHMAEKGIPTGLDQLVKLLNPRGGHGTTAGPGCRKVRAKRLAAAQGQL